MGCCGSKDDVPEDVATLDEVKAAILGDDADDGKTSFLGSILKAMAAHREDAAIMMDSAQRMQARGRSGSSAPRRSRRPAPLPSRAARRPSPRPAPLAAPPP